MLLKFSRTRERAADYVEKKEKKIKKLLADWDQLHWNFWNENWEKFFRSYKEILGVFVKEKKMYAEYYSKDDTCSLTEEDCRVISIAADEYTKHSRWNKIFLLPPHGDFIDDMTRYMEHSDLTSRWELYEILCNNIKKHGLWDKVEILDKGYYQNFITIVKYVKGIMKDAENK
jgi:hypothetical protein